MLLTGSSTWLPHPVCTLDNRISQVLIYGLGTYLEPFSHNLAHFTSLHLWMQVFPPSLSHRLMGSTQRGVSYTVRVPWSSACFVVSYMWHGGETWRMWQYSMDATRRPSICCTRRAGTRAYPFSTAFYLNTSLNGWKVPAAACQHRPFLKFPNRLPTSSILLAWCALNHNISNHRRSDVDGDEKKKQLKILWKAALPAVLASWHDFDIVESPRLKQQGASSLF